MIAACTDGTDGNVPGGTATMCGPNLCLSLAENPELATIGGVLFFSQASGKHLFVMRVSETELRALSALCTHQACTVEWDGAQSFNCPCHGSRFDAMGAVKRGPALTPLRTYTTLLEGDQLTIML
jgi:cytochrome b6-f complex iron-sulfur subunit